MKKSIKHIVKDAKKHTNLKNWSELCKLCILINNIKNLAK